MRSSSKQRSIQITLLNLGRHFALSKEQWPDLWAHLEQILSGQQALMPMAVMASVERYTQHCFARLVTRGATRSAYTARAAATGSPVTFVEVDPDCLKMP